MEEFNTERKSSELNKEEVNVYTNDCGVTRYNCVTDCFGVLALITEEELKEKEAQELSKEEINVYAAGCGEIQNHCKNDCFGGGSFLNPDY